jgi:hypothetical protein
MKTVVIFLTPAFLLAPALQAGDHKKPVLSSEEQAAGNEGHRDEPE